MNSLTPEEEQFSKKLSEEGTSRTYRLDSDKRADLYSAFEQKHHRVQLIQRRAFGSIGFACLMLVIVFFANNQRQAITPGFVTEPTVIAPPSIELARTSTDFIDLRIKETRFRLGKIESSNSSVFSGNSPKRNRVLESRISALREDLS